MRQFLSFANSQDEKNYKLQAKQKLAQKNSQSTCQVNQYLMYHMILNNQQHAQKKNYLNLIPMAFSLQQHKFSDTHLFIVLGSPRNNITEHSLSAMHCSEDIRSTNIFNAHNNTIRQILFYGHFTYREIEAQRS